MIKSEETMYRTYKEIINDTRLRNNDSLVGVPDDSEFMQSLFKDYTEFIRTYSVERMEEIRHNTAGLTSNASTGKIYIKLIDGSEWYVSIFGTRYLAGWDIIFTKEQI